MANKGIVTRTPPKEGLPLQTLDTEYSYEFFMSLMELKPREYKEKAIDLFLAMSTDIALLHNDVALLHEDVARIKNQYLIEIPGDRSCREYSHWARARAKQYITIRQFREMRKKWEGKEEEEGKQ